MMDINLCITWNILTKQSSTFKIDEFPDRHNDACYIYITACK